jgi:hypothetical protein
MKGTHNDFGPNAVLIGRSLKFALGCLVCGSIAAGLGTYWLIAFGIMIHVELDFIVIGGLFVIVGLFALIDSRTWLIVDDDGFTDCIHGLGRVSWDQVEAVRWAVFNANTYLYVRFIDPDSGRQRIAACRRTITKRRPKDAEPHEATVPITWYAVKPDILVGIMRQRMGLLLR